MSAVQLQGHCTHNLGAFMSNKDLAEIIGYKSRVSEIFSRKRKLTLNMIRSLHEKLNIPYESLIGNY